MLKRRNSSAPVMVLLSYDFFCIKQSKWRAEMAMSHKAYHSYGNADKHNGNYNYVLIALRVRNRPVTRGWNMSFMASILLTWIDVLKTFEWLVKWGALMLMWRQINE